jgi:hypothetical protein
MICTSCGKHRNELHAKRSKLLPETKLLLCTECKAEGREPRAFIIIVGRANGFDSVADYIKKRKYCGDEIPASAFV